MAVEKLVLLKVNVEGEVEVELSIDTDTAGIQEVVEVMNEVAQ